MRRLRDLKAYDNNARAHSDEQVERIAQSIKDYGFTNPILLDDDDYIVAGHGRSMAAHKLNMNLVPTIRLSYLSEEQIRRYRLIDNRLQELSDWDPGTLRLELEALAGGEVEFTPDELSFDSKFLTSVGVLEKAPRTASLDEDTTEFLVVCVCENEPQQQALYEELRERGIAVKVMS